MGTIFRVRMKAKKRAQEEQERIQEQKNKKYQSIVKNFLSQTWTIILNFLMYLYELSNGNLCAYLWFQTYIYRITSLDILDLHHFDVKLTDRSKHLNHTFLHHYKIDVSMLYSNHLITIWPRIALMWLNIIDTEMILLIIVSFVRYRTYLRFFSLTIIKMKVFAIYYFQYCVINQTEIHVKNEHLSYHH